MSLGLARGKSHQTKNYPQCFENASVMPEIASHSKIFQTLSLFAPYILDRLSKKSLKGEMKQLW